LLSKSPRSLDDLCLIEHAVGLLRGISYRLEIKSMGSLRSVGGSLSPAATSPACKSRRRRWRGSAKPFLKEVPYIPILACSGRSGGGDARGRAGRILHFEPIGRAAGTVGRVLPLRYDAFERHLAVINTTVSKRGAQFAPVGPQRMTESGPEETSAKSRGRSQWLT
jgi:hypothetical protein